MGTKQKPYIGLAESMISATAASELSVAEPVCPSRRSRQWQRSRKSRVAYMATEAVTSAAWMGLRTVPRRRRVKTI